MTCSCINNSFLCVFSALDITSSLTGLFTTAGIASQARLNQDGPNVRIEIPVDWTIFARWQIHELPVDFTVDPKLRCRPEYVGRFLQHSGESSGYIYEVSTASLVLHSIVLYARNNEPIACSSIVPYALPTSAASIEFKSHVFGRIHVFQWPGGEHFVATSMTASCMKGAIKVIVN